MTSDTNMPNPAVSKYDNYPWWIVAVSGLVTLSIYLIGAGVMYRLHPAAMVGFLIYVGWLEWRLMSSHCVDCFYGTVSGLTNMTYQEKGDNSDV